MLKGAFAIAIVPHRVIRQMAKSDAGNCQLAVCKATAAIDFPLQTVCRPCHWKQQFAVKQITPSKDLDLTSSCDPTQCHYNPGRIRVLPASRIYRLLNFSMAYSIPYTAILLFTA